MEIHKKLWIGLLALLLHTNLIAQQIGNIENGFNVDSFPKVSFIYHSYNPDVLDESNFWHLKEGNSIKRFKVEKLSARTERLPQTTLILWEDMAHNGKGQFNFTREVLSSFFHHAEIPVSDKFSIKAFNRRKNTPTTLINITEGFTNDKSQIISDIEDYKHSTERYPVFPNRSDLYSAIREGMELLAPLKDAKAIVVFTSGYSMKSSGADSEAQVLLKAQQLHIPVYIFQYYYRSGVAPQSEGFARSSFGTFNSYKDAVQAETALTKLYPQINKRYQGNRYEISFTSEAKHGAEPRVVSLSVNGVESQEQLFPPSHTLWTWISDNLWLAGALIFLLLALIIGVILFINKTRRDASENLQKIADLEQSQIQERELAEQRRIQERELAEQNRIQERQAAERYQRNLEDRVRQEREQIERRADEERLANLMRVKYLFPRLLCRVGANTFTYEISKPRILIGREQDNDLILNDQKVSRHHAEIIFNGSGFNIIDKQSTNKVIVNGQFVESTALKNGDIIGLGEVVITFYF